MTPGGQLSQLFPLLLRGGGLGGESWQCSGFGWGKKTVLRFSVARCHLKGMKVGLNQKNQIQTKSQTKTPYCFRICLQYKHPIVCSVVMKRRAPQSFVQHLGLGRGFKGTELLRWKRRVPGAWGVGCSPFSVWVHQQLPSLCLKPAGFKMFISLRHCGRLHNGHVKTPEVLPQL